MGSQVDYNGMSAVELERQNRIDGKAQDAEREHAAVAQEMRDKALNEEREPAAEAARLAEADRAAAAAAKAVHTVNADPM